MSNSGNSIKDEAIREIAGAALTVNYQVLGSVFTRDAFLCLMTNMTNGEIYLSTDGVTDMMKLPVSISRIYDNKTNDMFRKKGTQWYIRFSVAPAIPTGWFGLEVEYV
jgi:hypothetical protein